MEEAGRMLAGERTVQGVKRIAKAKAHNGNAAWAPRSFRNSGRRSRINTMAAVPARFVIHSHCRKTFIGR